MRLILAGLFAFGTWLVWSGHYTPLLLTLGVASCVVVVAISHRMHIIDEEGHPYERMPALLAYLPWLLWEIAKANVDVTRRILSPSLPISPTLVKVDVPQRTALGQVVFANSITLTPGTISLFFDDNGGVQVHALSREGAQDATNGVMAERVMRIEGTS